MFLLQSAIFADASDKKPWPQSNCTFVALRRFL
jgi:hypothetical protein